MLLSFRMGYRGLLSFLMGALVHRGAFEVNRGGGLKPAAS